MADTAFQTQYRQEQRHYSYAEELKNTFYPDVNYKPSPIVGYSQIRTVLVEEAEPKEQKQAQ